MEINISENDVKFLKNAREINDFLKNHNGVISSGILLVALISKEDSSLVRYLVQEKGYDHDKLMNSKNKFLEEADKEPTTLVVSNALYTNSQELDILPVNDDVYSFLEEVSTAVKKKKISIEDICKFIINDMDSPDELQDIEKKLA